MLVRTALLVLTVLATCAPGVPFDQAPPLNRVDLTERLWIGELWAGILASDADATELKLIEQQCGPLPEKRGDSWTRWVSCSLLRHKRAEGPIATVYAEPNPQSRAVAVVHEGWDRDVNGEVGRAWFVEARQRPGVFTLWPESSWAYGYGLDVAGIQVVGDWARLLTAAPVDGWLQLSPNSREGARYNFHVNSIADQIVNLADIVATEPKGQRKPIEKGAYLILKIENNVIEFRAEIPSDFSCGDPVVDPQPLPPVLRAPIGAFFDPSGAARFSTTYTKGC